MGPLPPRLTPWLRPRRNPKKPLEQLQTGLRPQPQLLQSSAAKLGKMRSRRKRRRRSRIATSDNARYPPREPPPRIPRNDFAKSADGTARTHEPSTDLRREPQRRPQRKSPSTATQAGYKIATNTTTNGNTMEHPGREDLPPGGHRQESGLAGSQV